MSKCVCKTKLGLRCKNAAKPGSDRCGTHTRYTCTPFQQPSSSRAQQPSSSSRAQQQQKPHCYKTMCDLNLTSKASAAKWIREHKEDKGDHGVHTQVNTCFGSRVFC